MSHILLQKLENVSGNPVIISYGSSSTVEHLVPNATKDLNNFRTAGINNAFKILMVQGNDAFVFNIYRAGKNLAINESTSKQTQNLNIDGEGGTYRIIIEDAGIAIQETTSSLVLKYSNNPRTRFYRFVIANGAMDVTLSN